jgi:hypothetical protein
MINPFIQKYFTEKKINTNNFYFIHTYKNMGTTILKQLPTSYTRRFYGVRKIQNNLVSIDHLPIDRLFDLKILNEDDILKRKFIGLVRSPIERFISMCNFEGKTTKEMIYLSRQSPKLKLQFFSFETTHKIDLTLILMDRKDLICDWFSKHGINLNLDIIENKSFGSTDIEDNDIEEIKNIFEKDFTLYEKVKSNGGILRNYVNII